MGAEVRHIVSGDWLILSTARVDQNEGKFNGGGPSPRKSSKREGGILIYENHRS